MHDNKRVYQPWEKPYYVLGPGDVYKMKSRAIEKLGRGRWSRGPGESAGES